MRDLIDFWKILRKKCFLDIDPCTKGDVRFFFLLQQGCGLTKKEVEDLLKRGAYGSIMEDGGDGEDFCEEDIDQILQRRTQVITLEAGEKGSTFAKVCWYLFLMFTKIIKFG